MLPGKRSIFYDYTKQLVFVCQYVPNACAQDSADKRTYDENPKVCESLTAFKQRRTNGTSRVDRSTSVVDTYQVD